MFETVFYLNNWTKSGLYQTDSTFRSWTWLKNNVPSSSYGTGYLTEYGESASSYGCTDYFFAAGSGGGFDAKTYWNGKFVIKWGVDCVGDPSGVNGYRVNGFSQSALQEVVFPPTMTRIGSGAFENCVNLTEIDLSETSVDLIGYRAFAECTGITEVKLPAAPAFIGDYAFYRCTGLETVNLDYVSGLGYRAFSFCSNLKYITGLDRVVDIGEMAFVACALDPDDNGTLHIPACCTHIGRWAFAGCDSLTKIIFDDTAGWNYDVTNPATNAAQMTDPSGAAWDELIKTTGD